jgi:DNA helicase IV
VSTENTDDLAFEAATNRRYLSALAERLGRPIQVTVSANEKWIENIPRTGLTFANFGPLVARVGLSEDYPFLGRAFYIGARWLSDFDDPVVSWDAPVARIFYDPAASSHELSERVLVRRTLLERLNEIVKVFDAWESALKPADSPFLARKLAVPSAPRKSARSSTRRVSKPPAANPAVPLAPVTAQSKSRGEPTAPASTAPRDPGPAKERLQQGMRSIEAVDYALQAPRSEALTSVLSTLQPDQYRLVTQRADVPLIVQGHPGTGKTIIGIHRSAYLVSPERLKDDSGRRAASLLFLGPTEEWVRHVSDIIKTLDVDRRVSVKAMPTWLSEVSDFKHQLAGELDGSVEDVGKFVKNVLDRSASLCKQEQPWAAGPGARMKNLERLYEVMRKGGTSSTPLKLGNISSNWIKTLPTFGTAIRRRRYLPLFAQASVSILGGPSARYDHVVVDEAQDVSGLEWEVIRAHNPASGWTLMGDMNQRRTDFGDSTWERLIERLSLLTRVGPVKPSVIERGYRSTQPILDFAKPLLARDERTAQSLQQEGPTPKVTRLTRAADRDFMAISEAERLLATYPAGTVAIITVDNDAAGLEKALLSGEWRRSDHLGDWRKDDRLLALRTPETARGVEFDGVVVVEPGVFPRNLARVGPLYTSLTRANRELAVVHHQPLPDGLRRHGRR